MHSISRLGKLKEVNNNNNNNKKFSRVISPKRDKSCLGKIPLMQSRLARNIVA